MHSLFPLTALKFIPWKSLRTHWYPHQLWRYLTFVDALCLTKARSTSKLAVSYSKNKRTIQPKLLVIGPDHVLTLSSNMREPNANNSQLYGPSFFLRSYWNDHWFTILTDHGGLAWISSLTNSTTRLDQWRLRLSKFDFKVKRRAPMKHQAADAPSQLAAIDEDTSPLEDDIPPLVIDKHTHEDTRKSKDKDTSPESLQPHIKEEILRGHVMKTYWGMGQTLVGHMNFEFNVSGDGLFIRRSCANAALRFFVSPSHHQCTVMLSHQLLISGQPAKVASPK